MSAKNKEVIQDPPVPIRVFESSPSDPSYPAENVLRGDPLSPGWRSMQGIGFPLFLAVELDGLYDISSVQFVAHEFLVPSEVELFTAPSVPATEWVRLGAVKMGTAAQHRARERKTFRFKVRARIIKFVFPDYLPVEKSTGQVSITSIIVRGKAFYGANNNLQPIQDQRLLHGQPPPQQKRAESNPAPSKHLSREMLEKAQQIRAHLDQIAEKKALLTQMIKTAEEKEDYEEAGRCATASQKLQQLAVAIEQLQIKKLSALNQQDYKAAGLIKKSQDQIVSLISKDIEQIIPVLTGEAKAEKQQKEAKVQESNVDDQEDVPRNASEQRKEVKFAEGNDGGNQGQAQPQKGSRNPSRAASKAQSVTGKSTAGDDVPVGASKPPLDINDPNFDPSQLRGKDMFKMSDEEERRYNELIKNRMRAQQMSDAEQQLEREKAMAQRPAAFKHDLTDQEYANLVIDGSKFPNDPFDYKKYSNILRDGWEKDENTPEELTSAHRTNAEIAKLIELGVEDMIIRLLVHKSLDKVREAVRFFDAALKNDVQRVYEAIYAVRVVAVYQQNQAMLYICQWLILRIYLALLDVYSDGKSKDFFKMRLNFLDVKDQIAKQKDDAVQLARFEVVFEGDQHKKDDFQQVEWVEQKLKDLLKDNGKTPVDLYNDVLLLVNPLVQRLNSGLRPARVVALNVLSTLTAFPLFSSKNLYLSLLSWKSINRFTKIQNEKESLEKDQRFQLVVEQRLMSSRALLEKAPFLLTDGSFDVIHKLLDTLMPYCNRLETKKAAIFHLQRLYDFDEAGGPSKVVKMLNKRINNATLLKQLSQELQQVDVENEVPAQIKFVPGTKGDKNDPPRIVVVNPAITAADGRASSAPQLGGDFPPGVCQFCCKELTTELEKVSEKLWEHIAVDCPCCCVCPACRQIVEVAYASSHLCGEFECGGLKDFQYVIKQCPKCLLGFQDNVFEEHVQSCTASLKGDQMICPLCGDVLDDGEQALAHYGDGKCQANPRTAAQFVEIIKNKVADT